MNKAPIVGSRWMRGDRGPDLGDYNGYTVCGITNTAHVTDKHPPQVIYEGDNGHKWSLPLDQWPGNLIPEAPRNPRDGMRPWTIEEFLAHRGQDFYLSNSRFPDKWYSITHYANNRIVIDFNSTQGSWSLDDLFNSAAWGSAKNICGTVKEDEEPPKTIDNVTAHKNKETERWDVNLVIRQVMDNMRVPVPGDEVDRLQYKTERAIRASIKILDVLNQKGILGKSEAVELAKRF